MWALGDTPFSPVSDAGAGGTWIKQTPDLGEGLLRARRYQNCHTRRDQLHNVISAEDSCRHPPLKEARIALAIDVDKRALAPNRSRCDVW